MMKSVTLVERAIQRAETAGRNRASVPIDVLYDVLQQARDGDELRTGVEQLAAQIGRRHPAS
jgi:hypothetical protein